MKVQMPNRDIYLIKEHSGDSWEVSRLGFVCNFILAGLGIK